MFTKSQSKIKPLAVENVGNDATLSARTSQRPTMATGVQSIPMMKISSLRVPWTLCSALRALS